MSYLDWALAAGIPTYLTLMSGFFFSKSAMICFQMSVRTPPLLSQKVIVPLPDPSPPLSPAAPLPSSPHAVAVSASTEPRATATAARLLLRMLVFIERLSSCGCDGVVASRAVGKRLPRRCVIATPNRRTGGVSQRELIRNRVKQAAPACPVPTGASANSPSRAPTQRQGVAAKT